MANEVFYPPVSTLISLDDLPEELGFIEDGLNSIFDDLYYRDLQYSQGARGDLTFYELSLVSKKTLGFQIPGSGFSFVLNPDLDQTGISVIPVSLSYEWPILGYFRSFELSTFSFQASDFYDLALDILGLTEQQLIDQALSSFNKTLSELIDDINTSLGTSLAASSIDDLVNAIEQESSLEDASTVIFAVYILDESSDSDSRKNLDSFFSDLFPSQPEEFLRDLITPRVRASLTLSAGVVFPRNVLLPLDSNGDPIEDETVKSTLKFDPGEFTFSTEEGVGYDKELQVQLSHPSSIGRTGLEIELESPAKLDLSRTTNIPEATKDGRSEDFLGVFFPSIKITLPPFFGQDENTSTAEIRGRDLLVGTGGLSGTIGLEAKDPNDPSPSLIQGKFGGSQSQLTLQLNAFDLTFQQNSIVGSNIQGLLKIPGFEDTDGNEAQIDLDVHIGEEGDFSVTASEGQGITALRIRDVLDLELTSLTLGEEDDRFFLRVSGSIDIADQAAAGNSSFIGNFVPDKIGIEGLKIWEDGEVEIEGGLIELDEAISLSLGPVEISVTAIGMGSYEDEANGREYRYIEFSAGVSVDPGGVDARGDGIKFFFSIDDDPLDVFVRIQSIAVDLTIPGNTEPENATLLLNGFLSMKEPENTGANSQAATEYAGGVDFTLPQMEMGGSAAMRMNPKVPAFLVDVGLELSTPIPLGSTGLGIYGFRALAGQRYVATRSAAGLDEDAKWWEYYKAEVEEQYEEGVQVGKFERTRGFSLGAGVSLATSTDSGKTFSSKLFFLLSLPEVFLLQGQGQILKERIGLNDDSDPPFFAIIAVTSSSIEASFGVDYKVPDPDSKRPGSIAKVEGVMEMEYFFGNSSAWYVNIGRDKPESKRVQARIFELFDAYFYLMLSAERIKTGAGATFEVSKSFGPLKAELGAELSTFARMQFEPQQVGGGITMIGEATLSVFSFSSGFFAFASLAAEAPKPFIVTGSLELCVDVLGNEYCADFDFTWVKDDSLNFEGNDIIDTPVAAKALNMLTEESFEVKAANGLTDPASMSLDDYVVPMDSAIDIGFRKGVLPDSSISDLIGGYTQGAEYIDYSPPQKGKSNRIRHKYHLNSISIKIWNPDSNSWEDYDIYEAATPLEIAPFVTTDLSNLKTGYWQFREPNKYNNLRILARSPFDYLKQGSGNLVPEDLGITDQQVFCPPDPIEKTCIDFDSFRLEEEQRKKLLIEDEFKDQEGVLMRIRGGDGFVQRETYQGFINGLKIPEEGKLELFFDEPMACVSSLLQSVGFGNSIEYYARERTENPDESGQPQYRYSLVRSTSLGDVDLKEHLRYEDPESPVDKVVIHSGTCEGREEEKEFPCDPSITDEAEQLEIFLDTLAKNDHLADENQLFPEGREIYQGVFYPTVLYQKALTRGSVLETDVTKLTGSSLVFVIEDNDGFKCEVRLQVQNDEEEIEFAQISGLENLREDSSSLQVGENYDFLIDALIEGDPDLPAKRVTLQGSSCYPIIRCYEECFTFLHEICYLNVADALFNDSQPSNDDVQEETNSMEEGFEGSIQPIWRPNSYFAILLDTTDEMDEEGGSGSSSYDRQHIFAFKTEGPIGHFHQQDDRYQRLLAQDREDEFKLKDLKHYIDYQRSFPNADGNLVKAKPLFYRDPKLLLFYKRDYVYEMFRGWEEYKENPGTSAELKVKIKDPAPPQPQNGGQTGPAPVGASFSENSFPTITPDLENLNNMVENGDPCSETDGIDPQGVNSEFDVEELKPLKLYTAIFKAEHQVGSNTPVEKEVHRYVFQTSRYKNFQEQIESYKFLDEETGNVLKEAIFDVRKDFAASTISKGQEVLNDSLPANDSLRQEFAHPYDRLMDGVLALGAFEAPVSTEFNILRNTEGGNMTILGILIRNPEPFNDPKLPEGQREGTISLSVDGGPASAYRGFFSKDLRDVLITNADGSMDVSPGDHAYTFEYRLFDGNAYNPVDTVTVGFNIPPIASIQ